jgi:serine phosphatase RsbU (regulator of sigma subunit)
VGGDLYEVVPRPGGLRLLIGDVRGKGLDAVRRATVVLGEFRAAAVDCDDLVGVAAQVDRRLPAHLGDEDFVTALFAEVSDDGSVAVVSCGHPPALVAGAGRLEPLGTQDSLPLGLGVTPTVARGRLAPGERLFLYTDGLLEAPGADRVALDLADVAAPLTEGTLPTVLERVLARVRESARAGLGDDLALLVAEYDPHLTGDA